MKFTHACVVGIASLLPFSALWIHADDATAPAANTTPASTTAVQHMTSVEAAQMERTKRRELAFSANQAVHDGERLISNEKYDEAADRFQYALDALNNGGLAAPLYQEASAGLAAAKSGQARAFAQDAKFAKAAALVQEAIHLQPQNPAYPQQLEDLKKQQVAYEEQVNDPEGTVHNPAVTENFKEKVAAVQKLLFTGDEYFATGQYDKSEETYSKVLILDPYNKAARDKMDHVERYKQRAAGFRHEEYEDEALGKVAETWSESISPDIVTAPTAVTEIEKPSNRAEITRKLESIIIPKVNFDKLDIATVIQFLTAKSKELDPDHQGINFVLRLTSDTPIAPIAPIAPAPAATPAAGAAPAPDATAAAATAATAPAVTAPAAADATAAAGTSAAPKINREVSITLENVPLADILQYIVQQTNLQYSVEDYAVYLRPSIDEGETLTVRTYLAPANFFSDSGLSEQPSATDPNAPVTVNVVERDAQPELVNRGIRFPPGASAAFLPGSSKLVVRDTPEQLDLISNLIENLSKESPQIQIEAKIAEFNQDALKGISFNYKVGMPGLGPLANIGGSTALRTTAYTTSGDPNAGLTPDSIDGLIQQNTADNSGTPGPTFPITGAAISSNTPNTITIGAILDGVGFSAVMDAINNITGVSVLEAPSITTQNGLKASIDVVREFPYPTSFEKPKLSNTEVAYSTGPGSASETGFLLGQPLELAVPPTPREFQTQDVGVSLEVKPTTYPDQRIDLDITKAQVVDFEGFIDYGVPIQARLSEAADPEVLTPGTINQPVFNLRSVVTNLQVLDGQTAVLGGLINESTQEINDKVPILGDLPIIGRLFQSKISERTKKNLLIFITARLIRSNGKLQYIKTLNAEPEEEALPEPASLGTGPTLPPVPESEPNS